MLVHTCESRNAFFLVLVDGHGNYKQNKLGFCVFIYTCVLLGACASIWCNYINNRRKKPFRNASASRRTKLLQSPDRLWSLIKQGISGLYGDYHYRPLEQSSQNVFLSPQALAQWFSMDYMRPQDMSPHSLNQFLHLPPFNKDWFFFFFTTLPGTPAHEKKSWIYKVEYVHILDIPLLVFMRMRQSDLLLTHHDNTWDWRSGLRITFQSHLGILRGRERRAAVIFVSLHSFATWFMRQDSVSVPCPRVSLFSFCPHVGHIKDFLLLLTNVL